MASRLPGGGMWFGDEFLKFTRRQGAEGLRAAGLVLWTLSRQRAGRVNTGISVYKSGGGTRTVYPNPSKPGEAPRVRRGIGQESIRWGFDDHELASRVGFTRIARYMLFHELGINYSRVGFQRRPTIVPTLV